MLIKSRKQLASCFASLHQAAKCKNIRQAALLISNKLAVEQLVF